MRATDGAAFNLKLDELAATVCRDDPRTKRQRRADALMALCGDAALPCLCDPSNAPPPDNGSTSSPVVIHVLAVTATIEGRGTEGGVRTGLWPAATRYGARSRQDRTSQPVLIPKDPRLNRSTGHQPRSPVRAQS